MSNSRTEAGLARFNQPRMQALPSALVMRLYRGAVEASSDYVKERLAQGLWKKSMLAALTQAMQRHREEEQSNADAGKLAPAGEQPADRAEAVHGT